MHPSAFAVAIFAFIPGVFGNWCDGGISIAGTTCASGRNLYCTGDFSIFRGDCVISGSGCGDGGVPKCVSREGIAQFSGLLTATVPLNRLDEIIQRRLAHVRLFCDSLYSPHKFKENHVQDVALQEWCSASQSTVSQLMGDDFMRVRRVSDRNLALTSPCSVQHVPLFSQPNSSFTTLVERESYIHCVCE
ncbi:hypothetical protein B0J12DRAFT_733623 [Macrophomina phaseolina]|uniref:Uncharacterized protein n=1 Tax=Macrophomina phaseolina TaxID=35725 RepID=A0ABQ8FQS8_9PEZI|nr:hypothetical protein B0J12DRAFT_733623 [Macrophomina phaseolina]